MAFTGQLNSNEIFTTVFNMIISQQVFSDNIKGTYSQLVDRARVDGSLYGDSKLYYATDVLKSSSWGNDAEAENLLAIHRPSDPSCQVITLNIFRQISLTVDNYLTKRAWSTENAFSSFNSIMLGWIGDTKKVYDATTYNAFIGTVKSAETTQNIGVALTDITQTGEEKARLEAEMIAEALANLMVSLEDVSRDFNDYKYLRSYDASDLLIVWNAEYLNKITKRDLPTIFHKQGLLDEFIKDKLPSRYFGNVNAGAVKAVASSAGSGEALFGTLKSLIEQDITTGSTTNHYFAGDNIKVGDTAPSGTSYIVDDSVICKIMHKDSVPYMSAFQVGTSFFNPKSLTENHYLTWGHNTLGYLKNYPMITVKAE